MTDRHVHSRPHRLAPTPSSNDDDDLVLKLHNVKETALACKRAESTIRTLVSRHQLRRHLGWQVYGRRRRRVMLLSSGVVAWLQKITLLGDKEALKWPPR